MTALYRVVAVCLVAFGVAGAELALASRVADSFAASGHANVENMRIQLPEGWRLRQDALSDEKLILGFESGGAYLTLYVRAGEAIDMNSTFVNGSEVLRDLRFEPRGGFTWKVIETKREARGFEFTTKFVAAFATDFRGSTYYGYSVAEHPDVARVAMENFLDNLEPIATRGASDRSLTGPDYTGKKYYLGWGAAASGDPSMMHNEVKYDVLHTHDIFTTDIGGGYLGTKLIGVSEATRSKVMAEWQKLRTQMTADDMFVQYSSGHGSQSGLGIGVTYNEIAQNTLSYPAKELVVFIMACHSGGLVDSFNRMKSQWENFGQQGRSLMVMASSKTSELSSTGPGTDPDQPGSPNGSAGSAFGHALWKSLIGYSDGYVDGVKDGFISLSEIEKYSIYKTKQVGGHTPVATGVYQGSVLMNKVPPKSFLDSLEGTSEGLSDAEITEKIRELDRAMRISAR